MGLSTKWPGGSKVTKRLSEARRDSCMQISVKKKSKVAVQWGRKSFLVFSITRPERYTRLTSTLAASMTFSRSIREHVQPGSELHTDALESYNGLDEYTHKVVDHAEAYVPDNVHTTRMENFWRLR